MVLEKCLFCSQACSEANYTKKKSDPVQQCKYMSPHWLSKCSWSNVQLLQPALQTAKSINIPYDQQDQIKRQCAGLGWGRVLTVRSLQGWTDRGHTKGHVFIAVALLGNPMSCISDVCMASSSRSARGTEETLISYSEISITRVCKLFPKPAQI